jgi:diaminohydroxyphosphoribosylaminopyrimidine deaminase/5-amino-6-(5-phosphoribosylamino)uracil reductase
MPKTDYHEYFMREALSLAKKGWSRTGVNPLVGAVVVNDRRIVGRGFHRKIGEAHAETVALLDAGGRARGASLYVNLEPCCTCGRTLPCVDSILKSGINRVVTAMRDPNPQVDGRGLEYLRQNGRTIVSDVLGDDARLLNRAYQKYITTKIPYVVIKIAGSLDNRITAAPGAVKTGSSGRYITGEPSLRFVHSLRSQFDAVLVGINTVLKDDPLLTDRYVGRPDPARIVIDPHLKIPRTARCLNVGARRIIITSPNNDPQKIEQLVARGAEIAVFEGGYFPMRSLIQRIGTWDIGSVLIEGGPMIFSQVFDNNLYDELYFFQSPVKIGQGATLTDEFDRIKAMPGVEAAGIGEDTLYHVYRNN